MRLRSVIEQIKWKKDSLRKGFDPEVLVQLYKDIDELWKHLDELPIERDPEER